MNTKEKEEKWKEYFDKLLNTKEPRELIKKGNKEIGEVEVEELTIEDVKKAIRNLKNNKVPGTDGTHPELIKYGGDKLLNRILFTPNHALSHINTYWSFNNTF
jgi:ribosomal protein L4